MSGAQIGSGRHARRVRELAAASRRYLPMPAGPTPLAGPLEVIHAFLRAWDERDAPGIGALFADDADYINVVGLWWTSRRSIERVFKRSFKQEFRNARIDFDKLAFRQLGSDAAVIVVRWTLTGQVDPDDRPVDERRGLFTFVLERVQDESWLVISLTSTDIVPAADTNVAQEGGLRPASYVPQVPELPTVPGA